MKISRLRFLIVMLIILCMWSFMTDSDLYAEDLVLSGDDVMVIENTTYTHTGNIFIRDNAKLILKNASLILNIRYHEEFVITVSESATLESTNSIIKTSLNGEIVVVSCWGNTNIVFNDSNSLDNLVYLYLFENFTGNVSIFNSILSSLQIPFHPLGSSTISVRNSSVTDLTFRFSGNYLGDFSYLVTGLISYWSYIEGGYNITLENFTAQYRALVCDGPAQIVVRNSDITKIALNAPKSDICSITAIDSNMSNIRLHGIRNTTASFSNLKPGLFTDWKLSDHLMGEYLSDVVLKNTTINKGWEISVFDNSNISINDATLNRLSSMGNYANANVTNCIVEELYLSLSKESTLIFDNTSLGCITLNVPPNSTMIKGNIDFTSDSRICNWVSPSTIMRTYSVLGASYATLALYNKNGLLVWSGQTDLQGRASFDIEFNDSNYSDNWNLVIAYGNKTYNLGLNLLTSTPILIAREYSINDAILILQILSGISPIQAINCLVDINSDGNIGIAEGLYILQKMAGIR